MSVSLQDATCKGNTPPAAAITYLIPGSWSFGGRVFAVVFTWAEMTAVLEPLALTLMTQTCCRVMAGHITDPEWDARPSELSVKFRDIKEKAPSCEAITAARLVFRRGQDPGFLVGIAIRAKTRFDAEHIFI
jgi:hypothetical protein